MLLYPRLSPTQGKQLAEERAALPLLELETLADITHPHVTYAPTGGVRVTDSQLKSLQTSIRKTARDHGYEHGLAGGEPLPLAAERKAAFDYALAVAIHEQMRVNPSEACRPGVWRFLGTVLAPEHIRWRFPGDKTTHERFLGNRLRNMYGRVWWRAHLLRDGRHEDPYWLLKELGEDELVQITERPNAAGYGPLATSIARGLVTRWDTDLGVSRTGLLREVMKRLLRLLPLVRFESLTLDEVETEIDALYDETLRGLGIEVASPVVAPEVLWDAETQWQELALLRRAELLKALSDDDIARLTSLNDDTLPDWGEYKPCWKALFRIQATAGQVLELAPEPEGLPRGDELGAWLTAQPAGSWQRQVDPARARRFLGALRGPDMQALFAAIGWEWPDGTTQSGSQRYLRRRYSGSWEDLIEALPEDTLSHVGHFLRIASPQQNVDELRLTLARWLLVKPDLQWHPTSALEERRTGEEESATVAPDAIGCDGSTSRAEPSVSDGVGEEVIELPDRHRELPEPPGLIVNLLRKLEVRTYGEFFALNLTEVAALRGVGAKKVDAIQAFRRELVKQDAVAVGASEPAPHPESLDDLMLRMLDSLQERETTAISMRFEQEATLAEMGDALGLSRERARQITQETLRRLRASFARDAAALLERANPGLGGAAFLLDALGLEPWQALLAATVAHDVSWVHAGAILWAGTQGSLQTLEAMATAAIHDQRIEAGQIRTLATELGASEAVLRLVLTRRMGWLDDDGALVFPEAEMARDDWILMRLKEAGPTHQNVVAKWLMERDGLTVEEQANKGKGYVRKAEQILSRLDDAWRSERGTFVHTTGLPISQAELTAITAWCVQKVEGRTGAYGVKKLLEELEEAGFAVEGLSWYVLKEALVREEALIPLRKANVACANSYEEHGFDIADRLLAVLRASENPLTFAEIVRRLPDDISYAEVTLRQRLYNTPGISRVDRGLFVADPTSSDATT